MATQTICTHWQPRYPLPPPPTLQHTHTHTITIIIIMITMQFSLCFPLEKWQITKVRRRRCGFTSGDLWLWVHCDSLLLLSLCRCHHLFISSQQKNKHTALEGHMHMNRQISGIKLQHSDSQKKTKITVESMVLTVGSDCRWTMRDEWNGMI